MSANAVRSVLEKWCRDTCRATQGEQVDPFEALHPDITFTQIGNTPDSGTYVGLDKFRAAIVPKLTTQFRTGPGFGMYLAECIVEGNCFACTIKGRGENAAGVTYNNNYFFFGEVKDQKIFRIIECFDGALVMRSPYNMRLAEATPAEA